MPGPRHTQPNRCAIGVWVWLSLWSFTGFMQAEPARPVPGSAPSHAAFLSGLEGPWQGQARVTPVGPRPYDMTYVRTAPKRVEGQAHPGASTHYWTFYAEQDRLRLRFLSTFGGNRQPLVLTATQASPAAIVFSSPRPDFLNVHVILTGKANSGFYLWQFGGTALGILPLTDRPRTVYPEDAAS